MIEFIAGAIFGNMFLGKDGAKSLWALPVALGAIILFGWGLWEMIVWYVGSAPQVYHMGHWYSWPWNWPGVYLSDQLWVSLSSFWTKLLPGNPQVPVWKGLPEGPLEFLTVLPPTLFKAGIAMAINVYVALLPLFVVSYTASKILRKYRLARRQNDQRLQ